MFKSYVIFIICANDSYLIYADHPEEQERRNKEIKDYHTRREAWQQEQQDKRDQAKELGKKEKEEEKRHKEECKLEKNKRKLASVSFAALSDSVLPEVYLYYLIINSFI